jgi:peptidoglycan/xylan/chitin deacetylase (PgdA/CDA1 family)
VSTDIEKIRVVVFTSGRLTPNKRVFLERLSLSPLIDLRGVIVDEYHKCQKSIAIRIYRGLAQYGLKWLFYKIFVMISSIVSVAALRLYDYMHPIIKPALDYQGLCSQLSIPLHIINDLNNPESVQVIRSLAPQLGVIYGGRILKDVVISAPEYGTLNIHKRKVPEYRGGGSVGYWEFLAGETSIGITIHFATSKVDAGPILAETTIPFEQCDTLESIRIKADIVGANLYLDTIEKFALGNRQCKPQNPMQGKTYRGAGEFREYQLQTHLKRLSTQQMRSVVLQKSRLTRLRILVQYLLMLPILIRARNHLVKQGKSPIWIIYYHVVANRPVNRMCLPLEQFVRHIEFIQRYYEIVSLDEAARRIDSGKNTRMAVAITFDDGYRDNYWAIEYLKFYRIPACFFVSIGNVQDQQPFQHDLNRGVCDAQPISEEFLKYLAQQPFLVGSHGLYHEDFGKVNVATAEQALFESKSRLERILGMAPEHFSFPKGLRKVNITKDAYERAQKYFKYIYSAYGGYNFPSEGQRHFVRIPNPSEFIDLLCIMDGYTNLRSVLMGNSWTKKTCHLPPY